MEIIMLHLPICTGYQYTGYEGLTDAWAFKVNNHVISSFPISSFLSLFVYHAWIEIPKHKKANSIRQEYVFQHQLWLFGLKKKETFIVTCFEGKTFVNTI